VQSGFDPAAGGLFAALVFHAPGQPDRLFLAAHHLVIDAVSWQILLPDLAAAYLAALRGTPIRFSPRTTSWQVWLNQLAEYSRSETADRQCEYWDRLARSLTGLTLGCLNPGRGTDTAPGAVRQRDLRTRLDADHTAGLLAASRAYTATPRDLVFAAFAGAVLRVFKTRDFGVEVETHGRHDVGLPADLDRTVGWFTSLHPLQLHAPDDLDELIVETKESLRRVPDNGLAYPLLAAQGRVPFLAPDLALNYLGETALPESAGSGFRISEKATGPAFSPRNKPQNALVANVSIHDGTLFCDLTTATEQLSPETAEEFGRCFIDCLAQVIDHALARTGVTRTVSDFSGNELAASELDEILDAFDS
jgi:non-ribosomal peptide synthase protein (TIGR01720 family)